MQDLHHGMNNNKKEKIEKTEHILKIIGSIIAILTFVFSYITPKLSINLSEYQANEILLELNNTYDDALKYKEYLESIGEKPKKIEKEVMKKFKKIASGDYLNDIKESIFVSNDFDTSKFEYSKFTFGVESFDGNTIKTTNGTFDIKDKSINKTDTKPLDSRIYKVRRILFDWDDYKIYEKSPIPKTI